ncbi:MAG: neutral zinc metallopeptidase [Mycobacteriaceae bacterium]
MTASTILLASCTNYIQGTPVSVYSDPFSVAGMKANNGPNGPRQGVPNAYRAVENSDGGQVDTIAVNALADIEKYWETEFPLIFGQEFEPVTAVTSWDSNASERRSPIFCGDSTYRELNAAFCETDRTIGWDRGGLLPSMTNAFGTMSVVSVLAHEYGHAVQQAAGTVDQSTPTIVSEQQADCFSGGFMRKVAEGKAEHFQLNTGEGLNSVLAATVALRDPVPETEEEANDESAHGSAFERVTAFQIGFIDGPASCAKIDMAELESRRGDLPIAAVDSGELEITQESVQDIFDSLNIVFQLKPAPRISFTGINTNCTTPDLKPTAPVSYCPSNDTIGVDLAALEERGTADAEELLLPTQLKGDYNAYVLVASRYALAVQNRQNLDLTNSTTTLRTACLAGVYTKAAAETISDGDQLFVGLSAGDIDEAVSGLLTDGLTASDLRGSTVPSGFSRVDAFRAGLMNGQSSCSNRYP